MVSLSCFGEMKDILKAVIPVSIAVILYTYFAEGGRIDQGTWPWVILLIITISIVVYAVIRLNRRKKFPKP
ncbi:hypothetical protein LX87_03897 [Larkinella arboricola]|uniref:Uncharacterized protein n=1 Tax=Larkinella arboricola TaxID=643671 RepID=A0A327WQX2_LARAB|nr:hypothetical protein [Larkinella arboricola]RAJ94013.1 hypothetical protein LX87_03897 [Larkinella arboricola]